MKRSNLIVGISFLVLAALAYVQTLGMVGRIATDELGPAFWPKCLSIAMGGLALLLIVQSLFSKENATSPPPIDSHSEGFRRVVMVCIVLVLFAGITFIFGIYIGLLFMLPLCMLLHGERKPIVIISLTGGLCAFIYLVFELALRVPLPTGIIFV